MKKTTAAKLNHESASAAAPGSNPPAPAAKRDANYWKVLNSALELDFKKGHLKWTMSELSRKSNVTRSLIYYHFGRSKMDILFEAVNVIGEELVGTGAKRMAVFQSGDWLQSMASTRAVYDQAPFLCSFYLVHRDRPTEVGRALQTLEKNYIKKLQTLFPHVPKEGQKVLFAFFFGITFSPRVDDEALRYAVEVLKGLTQPAGGVRLVAAVNKLM